MKHDVSQGPCQNSSADFMDWDDKMYLLIVHYFSKYLFMFQMSSTMMTALCNSLKEFFVLGGTLLEIFMVNRQPFYPMEWYIFTDKCGFKHTTLPHTTLSPLASLKGISPPRKASLAAPVPQALMKPWQTSFGPNLPCPLETLHHHLAGAHVPGQWDLVPIDLHKIW